MDNSFVIDYLHGLIDEGTVAEINEPEEEPVVHCQNTPRTRLTYNCAHLRSTKEGLTIEYLRWKLHWIFWVKIFRRKTFLVKIFWVKIFGVKILWVKIFWVKIFWVIIFLNENFFGENFWVKFFC